MTYGQGEPGNGWQPPADAGRTPRGRASVPSQPPAPREPDPRYAAQTFQGSPKYTSAEYATVSPREYGRARPQTGLQAPERPHLEPIRPAPAPRGSRLMTLLGGLAVVALLAVLATAGYVAFFSDRAASTARAATTGHDIGSQGTDPAPLAVANVFPGTAVTPPGTGHTYPLVRSQLSADCGAAVVGNISGLLSTAGCTQVVRATLTSPDKVYVVTTGIFNLRDEASARQAADGVQTSVSATKGRLAGYAAGGGTDVITRAATRLGWDVQGHFLLYCVVARADGGQIASDATIRPIVDDLVEKYLKGTVLKARAAQGGSAK